MVRTALRVLLALVVLAAPGFAQSFTLERETCVTQDGVLLVLKRLKTPAAVPVLLVHGLGSNGEEWDLPSKSFARFLAQQGFDVWIASCRRTGKAPYRSAGAAGYSFDDLACYDMPALVEKVARATGERPFLVGHSMGGMMVEAYLQGVAYERVLVRREPRFSLSGVRLVDVFQDRVAADPSRRAARQIAIRGAVAIASPPRLDWKDRGATVFDFWRHSYWDYNAAHSRRPAPAAERGKVNNVAREARARRFFAAIGVTGDGRARRPSDNRRARSAPERRRKSLGRRALRECARGDRAIPGSWGTCCGPSAFASRAGKALPVFSRVPC